MNKYLKLLGIAVAGSAMAGCNYRVVFKSEPEFKLKPESDIKPPKGYKRYYYHLNGSVWDHKRNKPFYSTVAKTRRQAEKRFHNYLNNIGDEGHLIETVTGR